uniref:Uncharacterized protein n=1 Tax=Anguilla anguilla TaxID=7936 RepID=A0A0E9RPZ6_ANGAN
MPLCHQIYPCPILDWDEADPRHLPLCLSIAAATAVCPDHSLWRRQGTKRG